MTSAMQQINTQSIADAIRDRIWSAILEVMPKEQLNTLVDQAVKEFVSDGPSQTSYGYREDRQPSKLKGLVFSVLTERIRTMLNEELSSPEWFIHEGAGFSAVVGEKLSALVKENAHALVEAALQGRMSEIIQQMRYSQGNR